MNDVKTPLQNPRDKAHQFNSERDWRSFHAPKNLAASITSEVAELLEQV